MSYRAGMSERYGDCRHCMATGEIMMAVPVPPDAPVDAPVMTVAVECGLCGGTGMSGDAMG